MKFGLTKHKFYVKWEKHMVKLTLSKSNPKNNGFIQQVEL